MTDDLLDLEAEMVEQSYQQSRAARARARLPAPGDELAALTAPPDPEQMANARRTFALHGTPGLHDWLHKLENDVIDLLPEHDQMRFRSDT